MIERHKVAEEVIEVLTLAEDVLGSPEAAQEWLECDLEGTSPFERLKTNEGRMWLKEYLLGGNK